MLSTVVWAVSGCALFTNTQEILALKRVADEQAAMGKYVEKRDARFEELSAEVNSGTISQYPDQQAIEKKYGPPVFNIDDSQGRKGVEEWIYRYEARLMGSPRVHLWFDPDKSLIEWRIIPEQPKKTKENI